MQKILAKEYRYFVANIVSMGRITIPEDLRKLLNLKEGEVVEVMIKRAKEA